MGKEVGEDVALSDAQPGLRRPSRMANRSSLDSGWRLELRAGFSRSFSKSSAIGGFLLVGGIPLRGVLNVMLCPSHAA